MIVYHQNHVNAYVGGHRYYADFPFVGLAQHIGSAAVLISIALRMVADHTGYLYQATERSDYLYRDTDQTDYLLRSTDRSGP